MKKYNVIGSYRGGKEKVLEIVGDEKSCEGRDGVNGDGCDEWELEVGIEEVVKIGVDVGLWYVEDDSLIEVDGEKWCEWGERIEKKFDLVF